MDSRSFQALAKLLDPPKRRGEEEEEVRNRFKRLHFLNTALVGVAGQELDSHHSTPYATPAAIGPPAEVGKKEVGKGRRGSGESEGIWDDAEVAEQQQYEYDDPRPQPK